MFAARLDDFTLLGGEAANCETLLATTRTARRRILRSLLGAACRTRAPALGHRSYPRIGRDLPVMPQVRRDGSRHRDGSRQRTHGRYWPICDSGECPQLGRCWGLTGHQAAGRLMSTLRASSAERDQVRHWRHITLGFDFFELMTRMIINPAMVASAQIDLFNDTLSVSQRADDRMLMRRAHEADAPKDKRFKHPEWSENAISILSAVREVKGMDDAHPLGCFLCWPSPNGLFLGYDCWHRRVPIDNTTAATQPRQAPLLEPFLYGDPALFCLLPTVRAGYRRTESDNRIRTEKSRAALVDVTRRRPWLSPSPAERGARASGRSAPRD